MKRASEREDWRIGGERGWVCDGVQSVSRVAVVLSVQRVRLPSVSQRRERAARARLARDDEVWSRGEQKDLARRLRRFRRIRRHTDIDEDTASRTG